MGTERASLDPLPSFLPGDSLGGQVISVCREILPQTLHCLLDLSGSQVRGTDLNGFLEQPGRTGRLPLRWLLVDPAVIAVPASEIPFCPPMDGSKEERREGMRGRRRRRRMWMWNRCRMWADLSHTPALRCDRYRSLGRGPSSFHPWKPRRHSDRRLPALEEHPRSWNCPSQTGLGL